MSQNITTLSHDHLSVTPLDQPVRSRPLVVDLDGTLLKTDSLIESFLALIQQNPFYVFQVLLWLLKGKAYLKQQISRRVALEVSLLPYNQELLNYLKVQRDQGRQLVLATGAGEEIARRVANYLQVFDMILASNGTTNLSAQHKRDRLVREFGEKGFDYAGNDRRDLVVWASAHKAIIIGSRRGFPSLEAQGVRTEQVFIGRERWVKPYIKALRPHQWLKNFLVFLPLILIHRFLELDLLGKAFLAFLAFSLSASSVYLLNDLVDLPADRHHPRKRKRPFAAGELSLLSGLISSPLLFGLSLLVGSLLPLPFLAMLVLYFLLNLGYSSYFKRVALLDVITLAGLYTLRVMAGSASVMIWPSTWLLAFSTFLFLSLALLKRYAELVTLETDTGVVQVRGYQIMDKALIASLGGGSGYVAVLVLVIYISSGVAEIHYTRHYLIWFLCPLLLYWISYMWLIAHRGGMHDDPVVFAIKDWISRVVILLVAVVFVLAI